MREQNDILKILSDSINRNNHQRIDRLCDSIAMLSLAQLKHTPVFYRENMIIIRKDFLCKLLNVAKEENSMRAVIYVLLCLFALHTPAVTVGETMEDNSIPDNWLDISLGDDEIIGVNKEILTKNFGLARNTVSLAMKVLRDKLAMVTVLIDETYAFLIPGGENEGPVLEATRAKENLECILELMTVFQQVDLLTSLKCEETDDSEGFDFVNEDEATEIVASILESCTITRWQDELLDTIKENDGEYYNETTARKIAELIRDNPLASSCGDFILLRQELLNYIILHGYRKPIFPVTAGETYQITKAAMIIFLYMLTCVDGEGYLRKDDNIVEYMQAKDIAIGCNMKEAAVSKAMSCWKNMGIVQQSSKRIRFVSDLGNIENGCTIK